MAIELKPRNNDLSCVHDSFVRSFEAGLLEPTVEEIIHHLPDNFPMHSIQQLCSMLKVELHVNCTSIVPSNEQLIHFFVNPETIDNRGFVTSHAEFLRPMDVNSYLEGRNNLQILGFIAFRGIECIPFRDAPEKYHIPRNVSVFELREGPLVT